MTEIIWGVTALWVVLAVMASFTIIDAGSIGVVFRFGAFNRVQRPGLNFIIPLVERVERYSTQTHQHELPDEPENIDRTDPIAEGKKPPFRVLHAGLDEATFYIEESKDSYKRVKYSTLSDKEKKALGISDAESLHAPLTSEISAVVEWSLNGDDEVSIRQFIENIQPEEGRTREEEVRKRIDDMKSRALQELLGPITLGHTRDRLPMINKILTEEVKELVGDGHPSEKPWGIRIGTAYIKPPSAGVRINEARADAGAAVSRKAETIRNAEAQARATELDGKAKAEADKLQGKGRAAHLKAVKAELADGGEYILAIDVARETLPNANTVVVPSDLGAIASVVTLGKEIAKKGDGK